MAPKKAKQEQSEESNDSEAEPLVRDSKKIVKKKSQSQQKEKNEKPKKAIQKKVSIQKQAPKKAKEKVTTKEDNKKNYLPGQRHPTPPDTDGAKAFYLSLLEQCPDNAMAEKWCLDYGCLDYDDACARVKKYEKSKK